MIYLLVALKMELPARQGLPDHVRVFYSGVGKVNAAVAAMRACQQADCDRVINYGTAGTLKPELAGQFVRVAEIHQRDMDARPMAPLGVTPFDADGGVISLGGTGVSLGTGDSFVTAPPEISTDIVDMEGYAIAKACHGAGVPFACYKYITDLADENATDNWRRNVALGAALFVEKLPGL